MHRYADFRPVNQTLPPSMVENVVETIQTFACKLSRPRHAIDDVVPIGQTIHLQELLLLPLHELHDRWHLLRPASTNAPDWTVSVGQWLACQPQTPENAVAAVIQVNKLAAPTLPLMSYVADRTESNCHVHIFGRLPARRYASFADPAFSCVVCDLGTTRENTFLSMCAEQPVGMRKHSLHD